MRKYGFVWMLFAVICLAAAGCGKQEESGDILVYYANQEGTALVSEGYSWNSAQTSSQIAEVLDKLRTPEDTVSCTSSIPADVLITAWTLEGGDLELSFSQEYRLLDKPGEVLLRAAVVKSLTQIDGVEFVRFRVGGEPLRDGKGNLVGYMQEEDFVQNTGAAINSYQQADVSLCFGSADGKALVWSEETIRYNSYMTIEKAVIERLIKGPEEEGMQRTVPAETRLLGVSIKDQICYVNLDEGFLVSLPGVSPEVRIYSLVNSVIAGGNCSQVQISVNGDANLLFQEQIDLSKPLEENLEIVGDDG